jgi:peptidoglycan/LPS O-acetylase OafA/YrhL
MVPLNFFSFGGFGNGMLVPQAWSLGLESQFYLVIPFIIVLSARRLVLAASLLFFIACPYVGVLDTDTWGYRLLPGTIFIFLLGSLLKRRMTSTPMFVAYAVSAILLYIVCFAPSLQRTFNFDVLAGVLIGVPVVHILSKVRLGMLDDLAGHISYGVFLNHIVLLWVFQTENWPLDDTASVAVFVGTSIAIAAASYALVERPVIRARHALRDRYTTGTATAPTNAGTS